MFKKIVKKVKDSPINYFSDLFIVVMVLGWAVAIPFVGFFAAYATIRLGDTNMWANFVELVAIPLTAGGGIWMIKNSIQHAIANKSGSLCKADFPSVDDILPQPDDEMMIDEEDNFNDNEESVG